MFSNLFRGGDMAVGPEIVWNFFHKALSYKLFTSSQQE